MAIPGQESCAPLAPCGDDKWGEIPTQPDTQHVDGSFEGGEPDGSAVAPWPTIGQGIDSDPTG